MRLLLLLIMGLKRKIRDTHMNIGSNQCLDERRRLDLLLLLQDGLRVHNVIPLLVP
jgi:hypothetical protein